MAARKRKAKAAKVRNSTKAASSAKRSKATKPARAARSSRSAKAAKSVASTGSGARTIVYVHGIGNKPTEDVLRCQWDQALMGFGLGERSRMAYWCQRDRHGPPTGDTCKDPDAPALRPERNGRMAARALQDEQPLEAWVADLTAEDSADEARAMQRLAASLETGSDARPRKRGAAVSAQGFSDSFNAPDFVTRLVTKLFLVDVRDFFFDRTRRASMQHSVRARLSTGGGPFVVVAHSQGSMVAYSVLCEAASRGLDVRLFLTIGSPLGLEEVRDQLTKQFGTGKRDRMPIPACVQRWVNVHDPADPVSRDIDLGRFYKGAFAVEDVELRNASTPYDPHAATGYLSLAAPRQRVREAVELERFQRVSHFTVAADVVADHERQPTGARRPLLIELTDPSWALSKRAGDDAAAGKPVLAREPQSLDLPQMAELLEARIREVARGVPAGELRIQKLKRYVSVHLTREETERLAQSQGLRELGLTVPPFYRVWRNARKRALLETSIHTVQASAAHQSYEALGQGVEWAVLDSGCTPHAHFAAHRNIVARWDCTLDSDGPLEHGARNGKADCDDGYGHGTHVAGIIAGAYTEPEDASGSPRSVRGIAPRTKLHVYKVLDDEGEGDDAWILKAIDHVAEINERAGRPRIAGVNLSLGGPYEQNVFACGYTPLCDELGRLWRQGVTVVLAAGNEGYVKLLSTDGEIDANLPFTVGDPANLDVAIAVGSIHKASPHLYGVSSFSSRGPTVDGRCKPDLVAPGEQILSCRHDPKRGQKLVRDLYYKLDGTSMAAPHVSGILAAFLSRRREFIGQPDRQKRILLEHCTDLKRERQQQGAGMPNLVRMLVAT